MYDTISFLSIPTCQSFLRRALHGTTTYTVAGQSMTRADDLHILIKLHPGDFNAHIYVAEGDSPNFDDVRMKGEGIVRKGAFDPDLSIGTIPESAFQ